jgi:hypothetical protein
LRIHGRVPYRVSHDLKTNGRMAPRQASRIIF